ncbi:MAG TPA: dipeptide ABC transporter ATP-binding protein [Burkholderiales bacterium]|jgi:ABC-type microcin C transport system duplicated ATPase subunit YejF|nr:dipeptide ABC transporter ATP-binding protein [Burkholderiales bacterium]
MSAVLQVANLNTRLDAASGEVRAVDGIDFEIARGECFALVGESGSGKSMTALSVMRLLPEAGRIADGRVLLDGQELLALPEAAMRAVRGRRVAMIFQEPSTALNPVLTVGRQIAEVIERHSRDRNPEAKVLELLKAVGIPDPESRIHSFPFQLSGGQRQRVMIAAALAADPEVLIADEPTTALDVTIQAQILELLKQLQAERQMAILFITHDLGIVWQMAQRVAVMREGKIVELASREEFFRAPRHPYSQKLFAALPERLPGRVSEEAQAASADAPVIAEARDLKVWFPIRKGVFKRVVGHVRAVDGVSLAVRAGRTLALVGESGSGKTTAGKAMLRLIEPTGGEVIFEGTSLRMLSRAELRSRRRAMQIVFQDPYASLNPRMRVTDILAEGMKSLGVGTSDAGRAARMAELLEQVGLPREALGRYPHEFSGGQRQRIAIARALAVEPKLIVCDEPTSALDVSVQAQILNLLKSLQERLGIAYLFITHNIAVVEYLAHEVAVMYQGRIVEHGAAQAVLRSPQDDYTRALLSAVPRVGTS